MFRKYPISFLGLFALLTVAGCDAAPQDPAEDPSEARTPRGAISKADALAGSCMDDEGYGLCGGQGVGNCFCDELCPEFGDCCADLEDVCGSPNEFGEVCTNGEDDNGNGRIDCDDPSCADEPSCTGPDIAASCDGICGEQHGSGCWCDATCAEYGDCCVDYDAICEASEFGEVCFNGEDDNGNGLIDCEEPSCNLDPSCAEPQPQPEPEPDQHPDIAGSCEGICGEAHETGCWCDVTCVEFGDCCTDYDLTCAPSEFDEVCFNGEDDNGNGLIDCDDPGCDLDPDCV